MPPTKSEPADDAAPALYATFPRRLNALSTDVVVVIGVSIPVFLVVPLVQASSAARITIWALWLGGLVAYEPVLVSCFGATIGHRFMNLRVMSNRTNSNISLPKAFARSFLKAFLGIMSFFTMNFSRRHQAIHDIVTDSSVRIFDVSKAKPRHYVRERSGGPRRTV